MIMINRRNWLYLLSVGSNLRLYNRHCRLFSSMAAVASNFSLNCKDPLRYFSVQQSSLAVTSSAAEFSTKGIGRGKMISLRIKGCCSSENSSSKNNISSRSSDFNNGNASGSSFELQRVRATSPYLRQQMLRELVAQEISLGFDNRLGSDDGGGACQNDRGSSRKSAGDRSLSEKIVVAVDVDEGICCYAVLILFLCAWNRIAIGLCFLWYILVLGNALVLA